MEKYIPSITGSPGQLSPSNFFSNSQINKLRESLKHLREENQNYQKEVRILNQSVAEISNESQKLELAIAERLKEIEKLRKNIQRADSELENLQSNNIKERNECDDSEKLYNEKKENKRSVTNLSRRLDIFREMSNNYKFSKSKLEKLKDIQKYQILFHRLIKINQDLTSQAQILLNGKVDFPNFSFSSSRNPSLIRSQNNSNFTVESTPKKGKYSNIESNEDILFNLNDFSRSSNRSPANIFRKRANSRIYNGLLTGLSQKLKQNYKVIQAISKSNNFSSSSNADSHSSLRPSYFNQDNSSFSSPRTLNSHLFNCSACINDDFNFGINDERYTKASIDKLVREKEREIRINYDYRDLYILLDRFDRFKEDNQKRAIARAKRRNMQMRTAGNLNNIKENDIDNDIVHADLNEDYDENIIDPAENESKIPVAKKITFSISTSPINNSKNDTGNAKNKIKFSSAQSNSSNNNNFSRKASNNPDPIRSKKPLLKKSPPRIEKDRPVKIIGDCRNVIDNVGSKLPPNSPMSPVDLDDSIPDIASDEDEPRASLQQIDDNIKQAILDTSATTPSTTIITTIATPASSSPTNNEITTVTTITETKLISDDSPIQKSNENRPSQNKSDDEGRFQLLCIEEEEEEKTSSGSDSIIDLNDLKEESNKKEASNNDVNNAIKNENSNSSGNGHQVGGAIFRTRHSSSRIENIYKDEPKSDVGNNNSDDQPSFSPRPPEKKQTNTDISPLIKKAIINDSRNYSDETYDDSLSKNISINNSDNNKNKINRSSNNKNDDSINDDDNIDDDDINNDNEIYPGYNRLKSGGKFAFSRHLMKNNLTKRISRASLIKNVIDLECQVGKLRSETQMLKDELKLNEFERGIEAEKKRKMQIEKEQELERQRKKERELKKQNLTHTFQKDVENYYIDMKRDEVDFNQFKKNRINKKKKNLALEQQSNDNNNNSSIKVYYDNQNEMNNDIIDNDYYIDYVIHFRNDAAIVHDLKSTETSISKLDIEKIEKIQKLRVVLYDMNQENDQLRKKYDEEKKKSKAAAYIDVANKLQTSIESRKQLMRDRTYESVKNLQSLDELLLKLNDEISKNELIREKTERILQKLKPSATGLARAMNDLKLAENAIKRKMNSLRIEEELIDSKLNEFNQICESDEIDKKKKEINMLKNSFRRGNNEDLSPVVEFGEIDQIKKMLDNLHKKSFQLKQSESDFESKINNDLNELYRLSSIVPAHYYQYSGSGSIETNSFSPSSNTNTKKNIVYESPVISQFDQQNYLINSI